MVTNPPPEKSPMPNYIPINPEKTEDIELGEINISRLSKVLLDENSKLETPVSGLGQLIDIQSETENSLRLPMQVRVETNATRIQQWKQFVATMGSTDSKFASKRKDTEKKSFICGYDN